MRFLDDQRRQDANDVVAGRYRQQPMLAQMGDEPAAVDLQLDPQHQAATAHAFKQMIMVWDHLLKRLLQHLAGLARSEEHTSELQSLMRISYAVLCLKKKITSHKRIKNQ